MMESINYSSTRESREVVEQFNKPMRSIFELKDIKKVKKEKQQSYDAFLSEQPIVSKPLQSIKV